MRYARPLTYIERLMKSKNKRGVAAGRKLLKIYEAWKTSLSIDDFLYFLRLIQYDLKEDIMLSLKGMIQMVGQFRAYSFEEFLMDLIKKKLKELNKPLEVLWNEKLPIWKAPTNEEYAATFDIAIIKRVNGKITPLIVIEAKVDVDAPRLKTALFNSILLKNIYPDVKYGLVYVNWNADVILMSLARNFLDAIFNFNSESEVKRFLDFIELNL